MNYVIRMRDDLAEQGLSVPASRTFSSYDTMVDVTYITAEELAGATQGDDPAEPDDHAYWYIKLKDGRSFYFINADLDYDDADAPPPPTNEYVVYWRREVVYKSTVVAYDEEDAIERVGNGFSGNSKYDEDIEEYGDMFFISTDLIEKEES